MVPTPHIEAGENAFAKTVIMPGDPLRAKMIAETFLTGVTQVNQVRGMLGYTGTYKGKTVSVMASGMGNPSMGIYSYELFAFYGVENIIRVGSTGAFLKQLHLKDVIVASNVFSNTNYDNHFANTGGGFLTGSNKLSQKALQTAKQLNLAVVEGATLCSDTFYTSESESDLALKHNLLAVEMEGAALYLNAQKLNKNALVICTISDNLATGEKCTSHERQMAFTDMVTLALEMAE